MHKRGAFRDLDVWCEAMDLVMEVYRLSKGFPDDEKYGLTAQLKRATVSIPSNIGEGSRRKKQRVFLNHLDIALGSQAEVDVQIEIAARLGFLSQSAHRSVQARIDRVGRMLNGLISSLQVEEEEDNEPPPTTNHPTTNQIG